MPTWLTIVVSLIAVRWLAVEARAERARRDGETTLYRAPLGVRVLFGVGFLGMVYGAGVEALNRDWWVSVLLAILGIFCLSQWPSELGVSKTGIFEHKWFGLRNRAFRWDEIASAMTNSSEDSVWVISDSSATIKHSKYHVDRSGFIAQMKRYCKWIEPGHALD